VERDNLFRGKNFFKFVYLKNKSRIYIV